MSGQSAAGAAVTRMARTYGGSLYELAVSEEAVSAIMADMRLVWQSLKENPSYRKLLQEPSIPLKKRLSFIREAFDGQIHPYLLNFLMLLCENSLLSELGGCFREYYQRFCQDSGVIRAFVVSAEPLTKAQASELTAKLERMTEKRVMLRQRIDAQALGGLKVELEGTRVDGTLKAALHTLEGYLTS